MYEVVGSMVKLTKRVYSRPTCTEVIEQLNLMKSAIVSEGRTDLSDICVGHKSAS